MTADPAGRPIFEGFAPATSVTASGGRSRTTTKRPSRLYSRASGSDVAREPGAVTPLLDESHTRREKYRDGNREAFAGRLSANRRQLVVEPLEPASAAGRE